MPNLENYTVVFIDGSVERADAVTREHVADGVLHLYRRQTNYGPAEDHVVSIPLHNILKWEKKRA